VTLGRRAVLVGAAATGAARAARAGTRLSLIVGAPAGALADRHARTFAPFLERHSPHLHVNVVNAAGRAGLVAADLLADAAPDGSVLAWAVTPTLPARSVDTGGAAHVLDRVRLVGAVMKEPIALVTPEKSPLVSAEDIIRRSSENAEAVPLGTPPAGSPPHLAALRLQAVAATRLNLVVFPSAAAAREAALAGNVEAAMLALGDAIDALRDGTLGGLGIAARDRSDSFPQMPPLRESGLRLSSYICRGLAGPAALSDTAAAALAEALRQMAADPEFQAEADATGFIAGWLDGARWTEQARVERSELAQLWRDQPWRPAGTS
jgi:tripartite-type tricarboxylate transporter receptor subunit TctC